MVRGRSWAELLKSTAMLLSALIASYIRLANGDYYIYCPKPDESNFLRWLLQQDVCPQ